MLSASGQAEEAEAKVDSAREMLHEIVDLFEDEKLRERYLENTAGKLG